MAIQPFTVLFYISTNFNYYYSSWQFIKTDSNQSCFPSNLFSWLLGNNCGQEVIRNICKALKSLDLKKHPFVVTANSRFCEKWKDTVKIVILVETHRLSYIRKDLCSKNKHLHFISGRESNNMYFLGSTFYLKKIDPNLLTLDFFLTWVPIN